MSAHNWIFAKLENEQLDLIREGESVLGVDYLVVYRQDESARPGMIELFVDGLNVAQMDDSEIELLEILEQRLQAVVVAYRK